VLKIRVGTRKYIFFSLLKILLVDKIATKKSQKSNIKRAVKALSNRVTTSKRATAMSKTVTTIKKAPTSKKEVKISVNKTVSKKSSIKTTSNARTSTISAKSKTVKTKTKTVQALASKKAKASTTKTAAKPKVTKAKPKATKAQAKTAKSKTALKAKTSTKKSAARKTKAAAKKTTKKKVEFVPLAPLPPKKKVNALRTPHLHEYLERKVGEEGMIIVKKIHNKEVSDVDLAEKMDMKPNIIRKYLYRLYEANVVTYRRHRSKTGWYTYYWQLHPERIEAAIQAEKDVYAKELQQILDYEQKNHFYECKDNCTRAIFEEAIEREFKCPRCENQLVFIENQKRVGELESQIAELRGM